MVAPLVGAWIEIYGTRYTCGYSCVAPLVGAWIEITECDIKLPHFLSLPSWERGLK